MEWKGVPDWDYKVAITEVEIGTYVSYVQWLLTSNISRAHFVKYMMLYETCRECQTEHLWMRSGGPVQVWTKFEPWTCSKTCEKYEKYYSVALAIYNHIWHISQAHNNVITSFSVTILYLSLTLPSQSPGATPKCQPNAVLTNLVGPTHERQLLGPWMTLGTRLASNDA